DLDRFKENIRILAGSGDRTQGSASYNNAATWLEGQLRASGYTVEHHAYTYLGQPRTSIYVTKVGTLFPDQMYIVSAHLDGRGGGGAANDDASGCSLVLESALALAGLPAAAPVRFVFWNNEESWHSRSTATVSVRDNQRVAEIGNGSNPYWHQPTDLYTAYSEADFRLGFNAVQMTLGTVAELAGAMTAPAQP